MNTIQLSCRFEGKEFSTRNYFIRVKNIGSYGNGCSVFNCKDGLFVRCGCFFGSVDKFVEHVKEKGTGTNDERTHLLAIELARAKFGK